jgi:tetratricopeptide (TPR) repeat protein
MSAYGYKVLTTPASKNKFLAYILSKGLLLIIVAAICFTGCAPKIVRVPVPAEDVVRANQAANEGDLAYDRKEIYGALIKYLESMRLNPNSEYLFNRMGIAYSQLKFYGEAIEAFRRAIALNPKYPYPYNNIGSVYFAQKSYRKSEKYFKKAILLKADEASFHMNLGSLYLEKKQRDKAMAEWRQSLALDPNIFSKRSAASLSSSGSSLSERNMFLARLFALNGNVEITIENLKLAIANGFTDLDEIKRDKDFDTIRNDERFIEFLKNAALLIKLQKESGLPENRAKDFVK